MKGFPSIFKKNILSRLPTVLVYPFKQHDKEIDQPKRNSNAELLAIAVCADAQGKGIGKNLILTLEAALIENGVDGDYFVTTNAADQNSTAFYNKMGFIPCGNQKHNDLTLQVFRKPLIQI
jgi:N-acetylglutamate synthase-like GNAT family acetyltransferase